MCVSDPLILPFHSYSKANAATVRGPERASRWTAGTGGLSEVCAISCLVGCRHVNGVKHSGK